MKTSAFLDDDAAMDLPTVVVERQRTLEGRQVFSMLNSGRFCLVNLAVFEDGVVDCGGLMDLPTLALRVQAGEVATLVPDGQWLSIFHLGEVQVRKGDWRCKPEAYVDFVRSVVKEMNPRLENIVVGNGRESKRIGNVRHALLGSASKLTRQDGLQPNWRQAVGDQVFLFERVDEGLYRAVSLAVYADGKIVMVGGSKPWAGDLAQVAALGKEGKLCSRLPVGATLVVAQVGRFLVNAFTLVTDLRNKLLEISDLIAKLNGRPDSCEICAEAFEAYSALPSPDRLKQLREAYGLVPEHFRSYILGECGADDAPIRAALGERVWLDEEE